MNPVYEFFWRANGGSFCDRNEKLIEAWLVEVYGENWKENTEARAIVQSGDLVTLSSKYLEKLGFPAQP